MTRALLDELLASPKTFFELMRRIDALAVAPVDAPYPSATGRHPGDRRRPSWLRLHQLARMDFAAAEVQEMECTEPRFDAEPFSLRVGIRHFGLFAPYGPLPLYITEEAQHERRKVFEQFFGHLTAELAWLDFKAWSQMHPVVGCDVRERGNTFIRRLSSLAAVTASTARSAGDARRLETAHHIQTCRTHFAGIYVARHRPQHCLGAMLCKYFGVPVRVLPRTGGWRDVEPSAGRRRIVGGWLLGKRVFTPQAAMTLVVGPLNAGELHRFHRREPMARWMVGVAEDHACARVDARLVVDVITQRGMNGRIGKMRIGIDTWASPLDRVVRLTIHEPCTRSTAL